MSDKPGSEIILGKKYPGEQFSTVKSAAQVVEEQEVQKPFEHENAVPIEVYFKHRRIDSDPVRHAAMLAFTKVRKATMEAFDSIFAKF